MNAALALIKNTVFLWFLAGGLALLVLLGFCTNVGRSESPIPPAVAKELADLKASLKTYQDKVESLTVANASGTQRAETTLSLARGTLTLSGVPRRLADSLARQARRNDSSAKLWHQAYDARTEEADSLRKAVALLDSVQADRERARLAITEAFSLAEDRRKRAERVNADLVAIIERQQKGCRFLFIPCPSRTVVGIVGVVVGAGGYAVLTAGR